MSNGDLMYSIMIILITLYYIFESCKDAQHLVVDFILFTKYSL